MFLFLGQKSLFLIARLLGVETDRLIRYDVYMSDNIKVQQI